MSLLTVSPHVRLVKAVEQMIFIGDAKPARVFRTYVPEEKLHELTEPYVSVVLGQRRILAARNRDAVDYECEVVVVIAMQLPDNEANTVDNALSMVEENIERLRTNRLPGINAKIVEASIVQAVPYSEPVLRAYGVFLSAVSAKWIVSVDRRD